MAAFLWLFIYPYIFVIFNEIVLHNCVTNSFYSTTHFLSLLYPPLKVEPLA